MDTTSLASPSAKAPPADEPECSGWPAWWLAAAAFVHAAAQRRGLTAGELGDVISERLCSLATPRTPQPALAFLLHLFADPACPEVDVDGEADVALAAPNLVLLGLIVSEAVANARRHGRMPGRPPKVWVRLGRDRGHLKLTVRDNGIGIGDLRPHPGSGRALIAAAAQQLGGYVRLGSAPFGGGLVTVVFPERAIG